MNNYADVIKNYRIKEGFTQEQLGELLEISPSAVAMYESGERVPRDSVKIRIANLLKKPVGEIFFNK